MLVIDPSHYLGLTGISVRKNLFFASFFHDYGWQERNQYL